MMNQEINKTPNNSVNAPVASDNLSLGTFLAEHRKRQNLSTEVIATQMKISESYIIALESDNYDALPGTTFAHGYIRAYARLLHLDKYDIEQRLKQTLEPIPETAFHIQGMPKRRKHLSMSMMFTSICIVIVLVIAGLTGTWLYHNHLTKVKAASSSNIILPKLPNSFNEPSTSQHVSRATLPSGSKSLSDASKHEAYPPSPIPEKKKE